MKKNTIAALSALCLVFSQTAWAEIGSVVSEDASKVVTLGEYKGLELTRTVEPVTDEEIDGQIEANLSGSMEDAGDGPVESGDTAVIDYEGKKDGEAFAGGTSEDYPLEIGSGTFIPGFEDGVIGMMKGETKDIELTFPEDYSSEELAGQDVVFTVTVKSIERVPELSDEWVKENTDVETIDEYKDQIKEELEEEKENEADQILRQEAYQKIVENCTFEEIPEKDIEPGEKYYRENAEMMAQYFGMELEDLLTAQGSTMEEFEEDCRAFGEDQAKVMYTLQAIIDAEKIEITDEQAEDIMKQYMEMYQAETLDDLKEMAGAEEVDKAVVSEVVIQFVIDNAVITDEPAEEAEETTEEEITEEEAAEETSEDAEDEAPEEETEEAAEETTEKTAEDEKAE